MNDNMRKVVAVIAGILAVALLLETSLAVLRFVQERRAGWGGQSGTEQRILCLGDSFVFGVGAPREKSFPAQLEVLLNTGRAKKTFRVINAGVQGQNTAQVLETLPETLTKVRPRIVVLLSGGSNVWNYRGYYRYRAGNTPFALLGEGISRIRVYKLAKLIYMRLKSPVLRDKISKEVVRYGLKPDGLLVMGNNPKTAHLFEELTRIDLKNYYCPRIAYAYMSNMYMMRRNEALQKGRGRIRMLLASTSPWNEIPEEIFRRAQRAHRLFVTNDNQAAAYAFAALARFEPENPEHYHTLALILMQMGKWEEAFNACKAGVLVAPEEENNRNYEGLVYLQRRTYRQDEQIYRGIRDFLRDLRKKNGIRNPTLYGVMDIMNSTQKESASDKVTMWVEHDILGIVEACRAEKISVFLVGYPENNGFNAVFIRTAKTYSIPFVDVSSVFNGLLRAHRREEYFIPDGHCNPRGYQIVAETIYKKLVEQGCVSPN